MAVSSDCFSESRRYRNARRSARSTRSRIASRRMGTPC
jgi:hypothetical protein